MKKALLSFKGLSFVLAFTALVVSFQNCSRVAFDASNVDMSSSNQLNDCASNPSACSGGNVNPSAGPTCEFNGQKYSEGETIKAYLHSAVASGEVCVSENRTCINGSFSGTYSFASCSVDAPLSCLFNGQTVAHGESVDAYQNSSTSYGNNCVKESRVCNNGVLSGSYNFATCDVGAAASCLFNGQTIAHGTAVKAFEGSAVNFGMSCVSEDRVCNNGVLSGSYNYANCTVGAPAGCLFDGQSLSHGASVTAYETSTVGFGQSCKAQSRTCSNGSLSGNYTYPSCSVGAPASCTFNGQTIAHGQSVNAFASSSVAFGSTCSNESRTCNNGSLSGSYTYSSCTVQARTPTCRSVYVGETSQNVCGQYIVGWAAVSYNSIYMCNSGQGEYSCEAIYQTQCSVVTTPQYETVCD